MSKTKIEYLLESRLLKIFSSSRSIGMPITVLASVIIGGEIGKLLTESRYPIVYLISLIITLIHIIFVLIKNNRMYCILLVYKGQLNRPNIFKDNYRIKQGNLENYNCLSIAYKKKYLKANSENLIKDLLSLLNANIIDSNQIVIIDKMHFDSKEIDIWETEKKFLQYKQNDSLELLFRNIRLSDKLSIQCADEYAKTITNFEYSLLDRASLYYTKSDILHGQRNRLKTDCFIKFEETLEKTFHSLKTSFEKKFSAHFKGVLTNNELSSLKYRVSIFYYNENYNKLVPFGALCNEANGELTPKYFNSIETLEQRTKYESGFFHVGGSYAYNQCNSIILTEEETKNTDSYVNGWKRNFKNNNNWESKEKNKNDYGQNEKKITDVIGKHKTRSQIHTGIPINTNPSEGEQAKVAFVLCFDISGLKFINEADSEDIGISKCERLSNLLHEVISEVKNKNNLGDEEIAGRFIYEKEKVTCK